LREFIVYINVKFNFFCIKILHQHIYTQGFKLQQTLGTSPDWWVSFFLSICGDQ